MGLWDTLTSQAGAQFLDVISWTESNRDTIVYRFPVYDQAITDNSKLVVREGQAAVFVSEGVMSDVFGPGTYTLDTRNTRILQFFRDISYALSRPYKGDIYFVDTTIFRDNRWGTSNPFMMRDAEFGPVRVRAFGQYDFRVTDPGVFIKQIVGTDGLFTLDEIAGDLKRKLVSSIASAINSASIPVLDLAGHHLDLGDRVRAQFNPNFQATYGLTITSLIIENVSLPKEVEEALDARSKMGILGNLDAYAKLNAAEAIGDAARNEGIAGAGVGMGVGFGMGNQMGGLMGNAMASPSTAPPPPPGPSLLHYSGPGGQAQLSVDEIVSRIAGAPDAEHNLWSPGWPAWKPWAEVPQVAGKIPPPPAAPPPPPGATTFHYSGPDGRAELTASEIAQKASGPGAHHVWKSGFAAWKDAHEVPEIAALMGPPPPP